MHGFCISAPERYSFGFGGDRHRDIGRAVRAAHNLTGAPGRVEWVDYPNGRYRVALQYGGATFRYRVRRGRRGERLTVFCCWSISGQRQRRQATVALPSPA